MVAPEAEPRGGLRFFSSADEMLALGRLHRERERRAGTLAEVAALRKLLLENLAHHFLTKVARRLSNFCFETSRVPCNVLFINDEKRF
ncbi:hypothetical protein DIPPA_34283 [Diplonema papillatum]|nr:hypothetical protein DIPPA_34283 [Diplonema papillatum]